MIVTPSAAITAATAAKPNEIPVVGLPAVLLFVPLVTLLEVLLSELLEERSCRRILAGRYRYEIAGVFADEAVLFFQGAGI